MVIMYQERKGELEAAQQTVRFFEMVLRASVDGVVISDSTQSIVVANDAFCGIFKKRRREVMETSLFVWLEQFDEGAVECWAELEERVRLEGSYSGAAFRMETNEEVRYFSVNASLLERVAEEYVGVIISIWRDVSERRQAEQVLRKSEEQFRVMFESSHDLFTIADSSGTTMLANPAWQETLGYTPETQGDPIENIHPDDRGRVLEAWQAMQQGESDFTDVEYRYRTAAGEYAVLEVTVRELEVTGELLVSTVAHDITERKRLETAVLESHKMAGIGTMAAGIAHEINSPLQVITGSTESMLRRLEGDDLDMKDLPGMLQMISRNAWRVAELVRSLLVYARPSSGVKAPHDLNTLVKDTLLLIEHQLKSWSTIMVSTNLAPDLPLLHCDRDGISQILINLLSNARDAMPAGGQITINTGYDVGIDQFVLKVSDSGTGIPEDVHQRIFDPFFTTKDVGAGTGMGLSIVKGIVEAHGGKIEISSAVGQGTTISILIPGESDTPITPSSLVGGGGRFDEN